MWEIGAQAGVPDPQQGVHRSSRKEGEKKEREQDWTCTHGLGELKQGSDPHNGATIWDREPASEAAGECHS